MEDVIGRPRQWQLPAVLAWASVVGWAATIYWFSSHTGSELPRSWIMAHDKILHGSEYALLGGLVCHALIRSGLRGARAAIAASLIALGYGVCDEYHQGFVPGRQGNDPGDIAADAVGGTIGALGFLLLASRFPTLSPAPPEELTA